MAGDFFDNDLLDSQESEEPASQVVEPEEDDVRGEHPIVAGDPGSPGSAARMAQQKEELSNQVVGAVSEIERLRMRQEALEEEKTALEELTRRQEAYERGKRDIVEKLDRSIVLLEKEEQQAKQMVQLLAQIRSRFKDSLIELRAIREDTWPDEAFHEELNKALVLVEEARSDYKSGLAKIEASSWHRDLTDRRPPAILDKVGAEAFREKGFGYWLKVGIAVSLPLIIALIVLFVVNLFLMGLI